MITVVLQYAHVCVFFPDWSRASARPRGTIQCGGNKAHERSHCGEMYKLLLHQRCLLGLPAKVSQKSAVCYFSFCVLSQWTAVLCYSQTATLRPSQPPPFSFLFFCFSFSVCLYVFAFARQPWDELIICGLEFPLSPSVVPVQLKVFLSRSWLCRPTILMTTLLVPNQTYVTQSGSRARHFFM